MIDQKFDVVFFNIAAPKYPSKMFQCSKRTFGCQVSNETDPNNGGFWFKEKSDKKPWCNLFKTLLEIAPWCLFIFSKNKQKPRLGSVSFETWHPKVGFEYWTIFEGYLWAEIFEKEIWPFGQSLIFNVDSHIFKIKDKSKLK